MFGAEWVGKVLKATFGGLTHATPPKTHVSISVIDFVKVIYTESVSTALDQAQLASLLEDDFTKLRNKIVQERDSLERSSRSDPDTLEWLQSISPNEEQKEPEEHHLSKTVRVMSSFLKSIQDANTSVKEGKEGIINFPIDTLQTYDRHSTNIYGAAQTKIAKRLHGWVKSVPEAKIATPNSPRLDHN